MCIRDRLYISRERYQVALRMKNKEHQDNALMNTAEIMGTAGMYKEAVDLMHNVQINHLPDDLHPYYYHIYRTVYGPVSYTHLDVYKRQIFPRPSYASVVLNPYEFVISERNFPFAAYL